MLGIAMLGFAAIASAGFQTCPEDGTMLTVTGAARVAQNGHLLHEYKCLHGHTYWLDDTANNARPAPAVQPDYSYLHDAGKAAFNSAGQQLGALIAGATQAKQPTSIVVWITCDHYDSISVGYSDGTSKSTDMKHAPVDRAELAAAVAATHLAVMDWGCAGK